MVNNIEKTERMRYYTIDIARAIAIVLVVIGHYCEPQMPKGYIALHDVIYLFHMPLFMFISGYLYLVTRRDDMGYVRFLEKKFNRLLIPYFTASVVILSIKIVMERFMRVDNPVTVDDFITFLYLPTAGYFLWFLWALWWCMVIIPMFRTRKSLIMLLCISFALYFISPNVTDIFCLRQLCGNLVYFVAGTLVADLFNDKNIKYIQGLKIIAVVAFALLSAIFYPVYTREVWDIYSELLVLGLAFVGIAMSLSVSSMIDGWAKGAVRKAIMSLSFASFFIYQYHTTCEGFAKGILNKLNFYSGEHVDVKYAIGIAFVVGCGVVVPYLFDRLVVSKYKITRFLFGLR